MLQHGPDVPISARWLQAIAIYCPAPSEMSVLATVASLTWGRGRERVQVGSFVFASRIGRHPDLLRRVVPRVATPVAAGGLGLLQATKRPRTLAIEPDWRLWGWKSERARKMCERTMAIYEPPAEPPYTPSPAAAALADQLHQVLLGRMPLKETPRKSAADPRWMEWLRCFDRLLQLRSKLILSAALVRISRDISLTRKIAGEYAPLVIERELDALVPR